ncbi:hypothetical protein [Hymenobacter sp. UYP22]|uniref:hypothetical protein n=1 Tax=Hymenobacter sp. UYP22 TaxID=3156348 RepID=UPI0033917A88
MPIVFSLLPNKAVGSSFSPDEFNTLISTLTALVAAYPMANIPTPASLGLFPNKASGQKMTAAEFNNMVNLLGQLVTAANGGGTTTPTALVAGLTTSAASIATGTALTFTASASGGTGPYTYLTQATNTATGGVINLGSAASGSWTPQAAGTFDITTTVTDAAGAVKNSPVRQVTVTAAVLPVPAPPTWSFNTQTRILSLAGPSGYESATLEYSVSGGAYQNYTAGLSIDSAAHVAGKWQGRVKATSTNQAGTPAGSPQISAVVSTGNRSLAVWSMGQSNKSKLVPQSSMPEGQLAEFPGIAGPYSRSEIAIVNGGMMAIQMGVNDRGYYPLQAGNPALQQVGGVTPLAWELERRSSGHFGFAHSYADGQPSEAFLPTAGNSDQNNVLNILKRCLVTLKADFTTRGISWNKDTVFGTIAQGETDGNLASFKANWITILDSLIDGGYIPADSVVAFRLMASQTVAGADLAVARANVLSLASSYTRLKIGTYDALNYNRYDPHHDDFYSAMVEAKQIVQIWFGEPVQVAYVSPPQEAVCGGKFRQAYSFVSMADAIQKAETAADALCTTGGGGGTTPPVVSNADPDYPYLTLRKQEFTQTSGITVSNTNTLTATGGLDDVARFAKARYAIGNDTTRAVIGYFRWKLVDVAEVTEAALNGSKANGGINNYIFGGRANVPNYDNELTDVHFGSYVKTSTGTNGQTNFGANLYSPNDNPPFDTRALTGKYLRLVFEQTRTILVLEGSTRAQDIILSTERYRAEQATIYQSLAWFWRGARIEDIWIAAANPVDLSAQ